MNKYKKIYMLPVMLVGLIFANLYSPTMTKAAESTQTVTIAGYYRDPISGNIEDSGGEDSYALGQSMVDSMCDTTGLLTETESGEYALTFRFHLMDNISEVSFKTCASDGSQYADVRYAITKTDSESSDFYIPLPGKDSYVRATCYVEAMGRSVVFFLGYSNPVDGNTTDLGLYDGSGLAGSPSTSSGNADGAASASSDGATVVEDSSNGLTIGYSDSASTTDTESQESTTDSASGTIIDDSVWGVLFGIVFAAVFLAGLLLIIVVLITRRIILDKEELRKKNIEKLDAYEFEEEETDDGDWEES